VPAALVELAVSGGVQKTTADHVDDHDSLSCVGTGCTELL
jgi:hypothetical protein